MGFAVRLAATGRERTEFGQLRAATGVKDRVRAALDTSGIAEKGRLYFLYALMVAVVVGRVGVGWFPYLTAWSMRDPSVRS